MTKQNRQLAFSVGVVAVLIGVLYISSTYLSKGAKDSNVQVVELTPVAENPEGEADVGKMYLGMKTWNWVSAKDATGNKVMPKGDKPFTLTFDFNKGTYAVTTDCNSGGGLFAAQSGIVQLGEMATTKMACEGSQESVFTGMVGAAQSFYFTSRGEMVLTAKDGSTVTFR